MRTLARQCLSVTTLALTLLLLPTPLTSNAAARPEQATASREISSSEAAARARSQYGGRVIKVQKQGRSYRVRLLQPSGRVITVTIRG